MCGPTCSSGRWNAMDLLADAHAVRDVSVFHTGRFHGPLLLQGRIGPSGPLTSRISGYGGTRTNAEGSDVDVVEVSTRRQRVTSLTERKWADEPNGAGAQRLECVSKLACGNPGISVLPWPFGESTQAKPWHAWIYIVFVYLVLRWLFRLIHSSKALA